MAYLLSPVDVVIVALIVFFLFDRRLSLLLDWRNRFLWMERLRLQDPVRWQRYQFQHLMYLREQLERQEQRPMDWRPWLILANAVLVVMILSTWMKG